MFESLKVVAKLMDDANWVQDEEIQDFCKEHPIYLAKTLHKAQHGRYSGFLLRSSFLVERIPPSSPSTKIALIAMFDEWMDCIDWRWKMGFLWLLP